MFFGLASGAVRVEGVEVDQVLADMKTETLPSTAVMKSPPFLFMPMHI
jgi:hypothetical protein